MKPTATVALSGECADEIFGGYPWYRDPEVRERAGFPWAQSTAWRSSFLSDPYRAVLDPESYVFAGMNPPAKPAMSYPARMPRSAG